MKLARAEAEAVKKGDLVEIEKAKKQHEDYRQLCLKADRMVIPQPSRRT
jgi:hypothetical protein